MTRRIRASLPTIELLRDRGASIVLVSHLGRPKGHDPSLSMAPVAKRLSELLDAPVELAPAVVGDDVKAMAEKLGPGEVLMLENSRFEEGETKNDPALAEALAGLADLYVNDAFGTAHRAHATTEGVAHHLPGYAGLLLEQEVEQLSAVRDDPRRPLIVVLGGAKVTDKLGVIDRFLGFAEEILIGGAMCFSFFKAEGRDTGNSLVEEESVESAKRVLAEAEGSDSILELPEDLVLGRELDPGTETRGLNGVDVPEGWMGLDVGTNTTANFGKRIARAGTVFWNGPMGAFEVDALRRRHARDRRGGRRRAGSHSGRRRGFGRRPAEVRPGRLGRLDLDRRRRLARAARGPRPSRTGGAAGCLTGRRCSPPTGRCTRRSRRPSASWTTSSRIRPTRSPRS